MLNETTQRLSELGSSLSVKIAPGELFVSIAGTVGKENTFGTCVGQVKSGAMSFARFSTDDASGKIRGYSGSGRFTDDPLNTFGGAGVVEIPGLQKLLRYICENGFDPRRGE